MTDIKRTNYATGQFLTAADFVREQDYHRALRQVHNSNLHTWGVGNGLEVTKVDDTHVQVGPGAALDAMGRDIVLAGPVTLDLAGQTAATHVYLVLAYDEVEDSADKVQIGGVDAFVATTERPGFTFVDPGTDGNGVPHPAAGKTLALALLTLDAGKLASIDATKRPMAGSVLPPAVTVRDLTVANSLDAKCNLFFTEANAGSDFRTNVMGVASIQNSVYNGGALEIYGRTVEDGSAGAGIQRQITLHDTVEVAGSLRISAQPGTKLPESRSGDLTVAGSVSIGGSLAMVGGISSSGTSVLSGTLIAGPTTVRSLSVVGGGYFGGGLSVNGSASVSGNLTVGGRSVLTSKVGYVMDRFVNRLGETLERGDVVVIGAGPPAQAYGEEDQIPVPEVDLTTIAGDTRVCGIVCEVHGDTEGDDGTHRIFADGERTAMDLGKVGPGQLGHMVTLGAYAVCKVDADIAPIAAGDLLTTSATRGHAQKVVDRPGAIGAIVGKALAPLAAGQGVIPILVALQ